MGAVPPIASRVDHRARHVFSRHLQERRRSPWHEGPHTVGANQQWNIGVGRCSTQSRCVRQARGGLCRSLPTVPSRCHGGCHHSGGTIILLFYVPSHSHVFTYIPCYVNVFPNMHCNSLAFTFITLHFHTLETAHRVHGEEMC
jgi:hypothetical protein